MTARLFLVPPSALGTGHPGQVVHVTGLEGRHASSVVRLAPGERVHLGDGAGRRALAEVVVSERHTLSARILAVETRPVPDPQFVLVQALARGDRDERAVEAATELGVDRVVPWAATRSVVHWREDRAAKGRARWQAIAVAATKASRRFHCPAVDALATRDDVEALLGQVALALVLHEEASTPLATVTLPASGQVVVVVGPEGGIEPAEHAAFVAAGGMPVRLGQEVLGSASAGPAALAVLNAKGRWA